MGGRKDLVKASFILFKQFPLFLRDCSVSIRNDLAGGGCPGDGHGSDFVPLVFGVQGTSARHTYAGDFFTLNPLMSVDSGDVTCSQGPLR